jgi:hypothetical protein
MRPGLSSAIPASPTRPNANGGDRDDATVFVRVYEVGEDGKFPRSIPATAFAKDDAVAMAPGGQPDPS